jgi:hypothetical protein
MKTGTLEQMQSASAPNADSQTYGRQKATPERRLTLPGMRFNLGLLKIPDSLGGTHAAISPTVQSTCIVVCCIRSAVCRDRPDRRISALDPRTSRPAFQPAFAFSERIEQEVIRCLRRLRELPLPEQPRESLPRELLNLQPDHRSPKH